MKVVVDGKRLDIDVFMEKVPTKGRPQLVLTEEGCRLVEKLASYFCTEEEIAGVLDSNCDTLHNKNNDELFRRAIEKGRSMGKESLRRKQWKLADKSATMAIFLGKQYLGQSDIGQLDGSESDNALLKIFGKLSAIKERDDGEEER